MKNRDMKYDWMRLIEVSGPFLAPAVLDDAFPTGLDGLDRRVKRELGHYYEEWADARENGDKQLDEIHRAWCMAVLKEGLGFSDEDVGEGNAHVGTENEAGRRKGVGIKAAVRDHGYGYGYG